RTMHWVWLREHVLLASQGPAHGATSRWGPRPRARPAKLAPRRTDQALAQPYPQPDPRNNLRSQEVVAQSLHGLSPSARTLMPAQSPPIARSPRRIELPYQRAVRGHNLLLECAEIVLAGDAGAGNRSGHERTLPQIRSLISRSWHNPRHRRWTYM